MASNGIACRVLIQSVQLEKVDMFPYLESLITEDGECTTEFRTRLNGAGDQGTTAENMEKSQHTFSTKIRLMIALVWLVATYGCKS